MLLFYLHDFYKILSTPYDKFNIIFKNKNNLTDNFLEDIYLKKFFYSLWMKKLNLKFNSFKTNYKYNIIEKNNDFIKIEFIYLKSFSLSSYPKKLFSSAIDKYLLVLKKEKNKLKVFFLINKEDDPSLYEEVLKKNLLELNNTSLIKTSIWNSKIKVLDRLYDKYLKNNSAYRSPHASNTLSYNPISACEYAENFALKSNPEYTSFDENGGDCTNFISQCLYSGGLKTSGIWKPYSNAWVRVEDLYLYIIKKNLGFEIKENSNLKKGTVIQFYTPKIGRFFHSGIITHSLTDDDYLYCCHSYNKLNYPLSLTYPILYPKMRAIELY